MDWLIAIRFVMGVGLGAEIVVGYVTISEFVPPKSRGRWGTALALITSSALFVSTLAGRAIIPTYGWRWMFVLVGIGALIVWFLRRRMPESPRWLESKGHLERAEAVMSEIEREVIANGKTLTVNGIANWRKVRSRKIRLMAALSFRITHDTDRSSLTASRMI